MDSLTPGNAAADPAALRKDSRAQVWHVLLGFDFLLLAYLFGGALFLPAPEVEFSTEVAALNGAIILVLMGVIPFFWVVNTRVGGMKGAIQFLKLDRPLPSLGLGVLVGFGLLVGLLLLAAILVGVGYEPQNPQVEQLGTIMTIPLAIFLAVTAAVGEEILFRGVLQKWLGWIAQGILFGLMHMAYGVPLQVIIPAAIGLLFGYLVHKGARLWVPIAAHLVFNLVQFLGQVYLAGGAATSAFTMIVPST